MHYNFWVNPIPTGHGRNQPIYERHVTKSGRNRVKGGFFSESAMCFLDLQISKKNIPKNYPELEI